MSNLLSSIMTEVSEEEQSEINCVVVRFGIEDGLMAGTLVSFITSPIHGPFRKIFAEKIPEDGVEACRLAWTLSGESE
jgi:hypothetical protein